jgi:hypothetical protein
VSQTRLLICVEAWCLVVAGVVAVKIPGVTVSGNPPVPDPVPVTGSLVGCFSVPKAQVCCKTAAVAPDIPGLDIPGAGRLRMADNSFLGRLWAIALRIRLEPAPTDFVAESAVVGTAGIEGKAAKDQVCRVTNEKQCWLGCGVAAVEVGKEAAKRGIDMAAVALVVGNKLQAAVVGLV